MATRDKIDRTVMRALAEVEKLEKLFANNGAFENAVAEVGGDIAWFGDVRENLKQLFSNIEELQMGAVGHMDEAAKEESVNEGGQEVKVIFRKFPEGDVIALFPEEDQGRGLIGSYMTVGQHGDASKSLITDLEPASKEEAAKLADELKRIGYDVVMAEPLKKEEAKESLDYLKKLAGITESDDEEEDDDEDEEEDDENS